METDKIVQKSPRREFLGSLAAGAATMGIAAMAMPLNLAANPFKEDGGNLSAADEWFNKIKGKHRLVLDVPKPHEIFPFAWPKVFLISNENTGTSKNDCSVVVVLRHFAIGYAFDSPVWAKYKLGERFDVKDHRTKAAAIRNPFWQPAPGEFQVPGIGPVPIGINELQADGVMFCVCDMAITVQSAATAQAMNLDAATVRKDWVDALLPGIQLVPSGIWALGRAQERQCAYVSAV